MPIEQLKLQRMIQDGVPGASVRIDNLRGDGEHYSVKVSSPAFRGLNRVQQHQLVYAAVRTVLGTELHALSLKTMTPEEARAKETNGETNRAIAAG